MFDALAPLHSPLDYSNPTVTPVSHTHTHTYPQSHQYHTPIQAGDVHVAHKGEAVLIEFMVMGEEKVRVC